MLYGQYGLSSDKQKTNVLQERITYQLAQKLQISSRQIKATIQLLESGATVPFIARYRKEITGSLNEVQIIAIRDALEQAKKLEERRTSILNTLAELEKLNPKLEYRIKMAESLSLLEDLYLPFRPKRQTRATIAKEKNLLHLAKILMAQHNGDPFEAAAAFVSEEKQVANIDEALAGARDIIAEWVSENARTRGKMRQLFEKKAVLQSKVVKDKEEEGQKYKDYFNWSENIARVPSHRFLAILRGVKEGFLRLNIEPEAEIAIRSLENIFVKAHNPVAEQVRLAIKDAYKRLIQPSMATEVRNIYKVRADDEAIEVFASNLKELLMSPPLGRKNVLAIDPGFRTGCKIVCLNEQNQLLHHNTIYPFDRNPMKRYGAMAAIEEICKSYDINAIAVGNGTAGRETIQFARKLDLPEKTQIMLVNESGASIYSASELAREEFPDHDITVRGAVSIGRRLMDPLAELVKIDPKSIGVGQYQHDVEQGKLKSSLDDVVVNCVNKVGVEVNTASKQLLTYVSGIGPKLAEKIVAYRDEKGTFKTKFDLQNVSGLGPKAFEQAAGFIRIRQADNVLDRSAVHPESYTLVEQIAADYNCSITDLVENADLRKKIDLKKYVTKTVGLPTLSDIMSELAKPGRDPREQFEEFRFAENVNTVEDLEIGMILPGIVTNVANFGAFVDIGVHQDGLVHISQIANRFISDPKKELKVQQKVKVKVLSIDESRKRINLSIKEAQTNPSDVV